MKTPCRDPKNDPDDWFISRDGKQYPSDSLVTQEQVDARLEQSPGLPEFEREKIIERLENEGRKVALRRRRHAKEACHESCYFRLQCLNMALEQPMTQGTWGGYYEEEIDQIRREKTRQDRARVARER